MKFRNLGPSGLQVSLVGLGCNNFGGRCDLEATRKVIHKAFDLGITFFDTADTYGNKGGSETAMGQVLGDMRKDIVLASKFANPMDEAGRLRGGSRRYIMSAVEASLRRLKTDWLDLYQMHNMDPRTPIEETLRALDDLVRQGKVRYIGCSNYSGWRLVEALWTSRHHNLNAFVSCQDHYNLLERGIEKGVVPAMEKYGLGLLPFYPLASGMLTGKYIRGATLPAGTRLAGNKESANRWLTETNLAKVERLQAFAEERGHSLLELAFSWLAARPSVSSVIAGATRPEQLEGNARAADWVLSAEDLAEIDRLSA
jgi:aryl-alcohol dehydrogenase-like predicted oxidoreductase